MLDTLERETEEREPALCEPEIIDEILLTGGAVEVDDGVLRFVGWVRLSAISGEAAERRVKVRFAMPATPAVKLYRALGAEFSQGWRARN